VGAIHPTNGFLVRARRRTGESVATQATPVIQRRPLLRIAPECELFISSVMIHKDDNTDCQSHDYPEYDTM
jgi:hypothetical protein